MDQPAIHSAMISHNARVRGSIRDLYFSPFPSSVSRCQHTSGGDGDEEERKAEYFRSEISRLPRERRRKPDASKRYADIQFRVYFNIATRVMTVNGDLSRRARRMAG